MNTIDVNPNYIKTVIEHIDQTETLNTDSKMSMQVVRLGT